MTLVLDIEQATLFKQLRIEFLKWFLSPQTLLPCPVIFISQTHPISVLKTLDLPAIDFGVQCLHIYCNWRRWQIWILIIEIYRSWRFFLRHTRIIKNGFLSSHQIRNCCIINLFFPCNSVNCKICVVILWLLIAIRWLFFIETITVCGDNYVKFIRIQLSTEDADFIITLIHLTPWLKHHYVNNYLPLNRWHCGCDIGMHCQENFFLHRKSATTQRDVNRCINSGDCDNCQ